MKSRLFIFISFLIIATSANSVADVSRDSAYRFSGKSEIEVQRFDQNLLDEFHSNDEFLYNLPPENRPNYLKVLFQKFFEWLVFIFGNEVVAWLVIVLLLIIGVIGLGFAFYGIFGIGKTIPIFNQEDGSIDYVVKEENIHEINFPDEIETSVVQKNYKKAIRLIYLYSLKLLTDQEIIDWQSAKTNHDYVYEIQNELFRNNFEKVCYYFEYVWYGDFAANAMHYKEISQAFTGLKDNLTKDV